MSCRVYEPELLQQAVNRSGVSGSLSYKSLQRRQKNDSISSEQHHPQQPAVLSYPKKTFLLTKAPSNAEREASLRIAKQQQAKRIMRDKAYWAEQTRMRADSERKLKDRLERKALEKEIRFNNLCVSLDVGKQVQAEIDASLDLQEKREQRKREARFQEWSEKVFKPISDKIQDELKRRDVKALINMRRKEYNKFLETTNQKKSLFLDIIIESDYDPFVPNKQSIRYSTGPMDDPIKRVLTKDDEEKNMIPGVRRETSTRPSRGMLDVKMWGAGKVESTPHGHFAKMMDDSGGPKTEKVHLYKTKWEINHFNVPRGKAVTDAEFPKGKRTDFEANGVHVVR